jgi:cytochrome c oxidase cbb3-type subunit 3
MDVRAALVIGGTVAIAALGLTGCGRPAGVAASTASVPAIRTPVGPVPGASVNPPRFTNPLGTDPVAMEDGRRLFVHMNCSGCHGGHAGGGMGPSLRDVDWMYGDSDAQIFSSIAEGRAHGMPAWGTKLPDDQLWRLVAYIRAMRTPDEPDPPS